MTTTLEAPAQTAHYGSRAEDLAELYATMLQDAGWTVGIQTTLYEGHYDVSGEMFASERVHVILTATRHKSGHLVASWTSVTKAVQGRRCTTKRGLSVRCDTYPAEPKKLVTHRQFWAAIEEMTR